MREIVKKASKKKKYQKPGIIFAKKMEVVSAVCSSGFGGLGGCKSVGTCARALQ